MQTCDLTTKHYDNWMVIDKSIHVTAELTEQKVILASEVRVPEQENYEGEDGNKEYASVRSNTEIHQPLEILHTFV